MFAEAGQHLAGGNRRIQRGGELRVAFNIVGVKGLFNPDQIELLHFAPHADSGFAIPLLVGVHHQREVIAQHLTHRRQATNIFGGIRLTNLQLNPANPVLTGDSHVF